MKSDSALEIFPMTTGVGKDGNLTLAGVDLFSLAKTWGTPLYLYDSVTVRRQVSILEQALKDHYPAKAQVCYAAKAYFSSGLAVHLKQMGVDVDTVSLGEMMVARKAGFRGSQVHLHGNNKSRAELEMAITWGIQSIVVDSLDELDFLGTIASGLGAPVRIWLRITPGIEVDTHPYRQTGHSASKFGLSIEDNQAGLAIQKAKANPWLTLTGLHFHLGSQSFDPTPYRRGIMALYHLAETQDFIPTQFSPGGGWGVRYTADDPADDVKPWVAGISETVCEVCRRLGWPLPELLLEPGRSLIARAGLALYSVGAQKQLPDGCKVLALDGGMADNPRPALYQSRYTALRVRQPYLGERSPMRLVGRFCESGDELIHEVLLPEVQRGDLIAIPTAGAYQLSMSSNYNLTPRPAVLWVEDNKVECIQAREPDECGPWWG